MSLSHVQLFTTPWTAAHQAPLSMGFFRQEYWSGAPLPSPNWILNTCQILANKKGLFSPFSFLSICSFPLSSFFPPSRLLPCILSFFLFLPFGCTSFSVKSDSLILHQSCWRQNVNSNVLALMSYNFYTSVPKTEYCLKYKFKYNFKYNKWNILAKYI